MAEAAGLSQGVTVFYFKTKQALLAEALRWHYEEYRSRLARGPRGGAGRPGRRASWPWCAPISIPPSATGARSLSGTPSGARPPPARCSPASPRSFDRERAVVLREQCEAAADLLDATAWTPATLAIAIDSLTDGLWIHMHLDSEAMDTAAAARHRHPRDRGRIPVATPRRSWQSIRRMMRRARHLSPIGLDPRRLDGLA